MNQTTRIELEELMNKFFKQGTQIHVTDYEKTEAGIHLGLSANFNLDPFGGNYIPDELPFHLNIFNEDGYWRFKHDCRLHFLGPEDSGPKVQEKLALIESRLGLLEETILKNCSEIKNRLVAMNNIGRFD